MDFETQAFNEIKKYLETLGYPESSILPEYNIRGSFIDAVVKTQDEVLIAIEIKTRSIESISSDEIGYHPVTRNLQKTAAELGAKYYLLSNGKEHAWLKTGENGRPEKTIAIPFTQFNEITLSEYEYTKALLIHVAEYIRNFPITGEYLFDISIVLFAKLKQDIDGKGTVPSGLWDILGGNHLQGYSTEKTFKSALDRLEGVDLMDNRLAVFEFIDNLFALSRKEWIVPRWMADFMVSLINKDKDARLLNLYSQNGLISSAAFLREFRFVDSYYTSPQELYWIKIQQILGDAFESEIKFEPGLLKGAFEFLPLNTMDAVLLAPPFNLKFEESVNSYLGRQGIRDGNTLFLEACLNVTKKDGLVVAIVPDSFLLSTQFIKARKYFLYEIEAIVSLPDGAFKPYSSVKTSLIILRKGKPHIQRKVFMSFLKEVPMYNPLYEKSNNEISNILGNIAKFRGDEFIESSENGFIVEQIEESNFHVSKYWLDKRLASSSYLHSKYAVLPLVEVVKEIFRGSSLVNDAEGNIACINQAAVRELRISKENISYTSVEKLPRGKVKRILAGDVLVNIIGPYRGKAALVTKEFDGFLVNRHIAVVRPNTNYVLSGYLAIALNSQFVQEQLRGQASGAVIPSLSLFSFDQISLPVPSLDTQRRLQEHFSRLLDELVSIREAEARLEGEISKSLTGLGKGGEDI